MSAMNWCLQEAANSLQGAQVVGDGAIRISRVHTDTRTTQAGDLFVALKGECFDGVQFLQQAADAGAVAALCRTCARDQLLAAKLSGILVPDVKLALGQLARAWRQRFHGSLVAITGSNGKTTVTQMMASILHAWKGAASLATQGNFNNDIGVPLTLLRLRPEHEVAVVELGMNHPGEIAHLAAMTAPTVALVNNAQREHLEFMSSVDAVARENASVFTALGREGVAVFPIDDPYAHLWRKLNDGRAICLFSQTPGVVPVALCGAVWRDDAWVMQAETPLGVVACELHIAGRHNLHNALAAIACAVSVGVPLEAIQRGLSQFRPVHGRSMAKTLRYRGRMVTLVDDTYNANPDSVRALVDVLAELPGPRLLVLGDMGEVGEDGIAMHAEAGRYARERGIDRLLTHGPLSVHAAMAFGGGRHFIQMDELIEAVRTNLSHSVSIAVKGSRFMKMERVVQALTSSVAAEQEQADVA